MCQPVSGPEAVLEEQWAWKVFDDKDLKPLHYSLKGKLGGGGFYEREKWYTSTGVREVSSKTMGGFHVFKLKEDAERYGSSSAHVEKVRIRGQALPFNGADGPGWAVHEMMIPVQPSLPKRI